MFSLVKPKKISDNVYAFINGNDFLINFNTSLVKFSTGETQFPPCCIPIKELFNENFDAACRIDKPVNIIVPTEWKSIIINAADVSMFNAVASAGEDLFWSGSMAINNKRMVIDTVGLVYATHFVSPKMTDIEISSELDYNSFYYLYQMFKHITGKKTANLKISETEDYVFFTNEEETHYIIVNTKSTELAFKSGSSGLISSLASKDCDPATSSTKKYVIDVIKDGLIKHLIKFLGDTMSLSQNDIFYKMNSHFGELYLFKKKE